VKCKLNGEQYALKVLDKEKITRLGKIENVMRERDNLFSLADHPNVMRLELTF